MRTLARDLRKELDRTARQARHVAETGAKKVLEQLAVHHHEPWGSMTPDQRALRNRLRAHGRQLGDQRDSKRGTQAGPDTPDTGIGALAAERPSRRAMDQDQHRVPQGWSGRGVQGSCRVGVPLRHCASLPCRPGAVPGSRVFARAPRNDQPVRQQPRCGVSADPGCRRRL
jgi:hypothetical protein